MLPKQCNTTEEQAQTRRDDYQGKQCTTWADITLPSAPHHLLASALLPSMAQRFRVTSSTMVRAATPTPDTAPVTGHYTRYGTLHLLRDAAPDQNGCIAYGSGAAPTLTSTTADQTTSTRGRQYPMPRHVFELPDRGLNSFRIQPPSDTSTDSEAHP